MMQHDNVFKLAEIGRSMGNLLDVLKNTAQRKHLRKQVLRALDVSVTDFVQFVDGQRGEVASFYLQGRSQQQGEIVFDCYYLQNVQLGLKHLPGSIQIGNYTFFLSYRKTTRQGIMQVNYEELKGQPKKPAAPS